MPEIPKMFEAYFSILETQAKRLEEIGSQPECKSQQASLLEVVAALRREVEAMRAQVQILYDWS
jgi:hypothetical protein